MNSRTLALASAVVAAAAFAVKAFVIASAGLGESGLEDMFFFLGQIAMTVSAASLGVWLTSGRPVGTRVLGAVATVLGLAVVIGVVAVLISAATPDEAGWVWGEINLWVGAAVLLAVVIALQRRSPITHA
jgi:hypothetical protein